MRFPKPRSNARPRPCLLHLHIPIPITYEKASSLQDHLVALHERARKFPQSFKPPPPTVLTFSTIPTYTLGRRETSLPQSQLDHLASPVFIPRTGQSTSAEVIKTLRGGQTTFHGPGQLVIYPILSLASSTIQVPKFPGEILPKPSRYRVEPIPKPEEQSKFSRFRFTPKCYVGLLEDTVISVLGSYGIQGMKTKNPGVWVSEEEKIAALGVHIQRMVTSHGVAINVETDLEWFDRIVACGLEGKKTTSMERILSERGEKVPDVKYVAGRWVGEFASRLGFSVVAGDVKRFHDAHYFLGSGFMQYKLVKLRQVEHRFGRNELRFRFGEHGYIESLF